MAILWCGSEDVDFDYVFDASVVGSMKPNYTRAAFSVGASSVGALQLRSPTFSPITTGTGGLGCLWQNRNEWTAYNKPAAILSDSAHGYGGVGFGIGSTGNKIALFVVSSGGTATKLVEEAGTVFSFDETVDRVDLLFGGMGGDGWAKIWVNGTLVIDYVGTLSPSGVTSLDCLCVISVNRIHQCGAFIVATEDTRTMDLVSLAPSGAGSVNQWSGAYTDINETTVNDVTLLSSSAGDQDAQFALTNLPTGTFTIRAVQVSARASGSDGRDVQLGVKCGSDVILSATKTLGPAQASGIFEVFSTNTAQSRAFTQAEVDSLEIALRSKTR